MKTYGYVRVSTREQNEDRQMIALREIGVAAQNIYLDKQIRQGFQPAPVQKASAEIKKRRSALTMTAIASVSAEQFFKRCVIF